MDKLERNNYLKEIEYFKEYIIDKETGKVNTEKYKKWFLDHVNNRNESSLRSVVEKVNEANFITVEACHDLNVKSEDILLNGNLTNESLVKFILNESKSADQKNEIKEVVKSIIDGDNDKDDENKDDENKDSSSNPDSPELSDERLTDAVKVIVTYLTKTFEDEKNEETGKKNLSDNFTELTEVLKKKGYSEKDIASKFDDIEKEISSDKESSGSKAKRKEEEYNPYKDWRYFYYMWTLGVSFNMYLLPSTFNAKKMFLEKDSQVNKTQKAIKDVQDASIMMDAPKTVYEQPYILRFIQLEGKYGLDIDLEMMRSEFKNAATMSQAKSIYKGYFELFYKQGKDKMTDIISLSKDFESFVEEMAFADHFQNFASFGGMNGGEFFDYVMGLREKDCNITLLFENELISNFGAVSEISTDKLIPFVEEKFNNAYKNIDKEDENHDYIRESMACFVLLDRIHSERPKSFKFLHPFQYSAEKNAVDRMRNQMDAKMNENHNKDAEELKRMRTHSVVYKEGFEEERRTMRTFSLHMTSKRMDPRLDVDLERDLHSDNLSPTRSLDALDVNKNTIRELDDIQEIPLIEDDDDDMIQGNGIISNEPQNDDINK